VCRWWNATGTETYSPFAVSGLWHCNACQQHGARPHAAHTALDISNILIIKPTRCTNFSNLFLELKNPHVSDSSSVHHKEFHTVHTAMVYQDQDGTISVLILLASCQQPCMAYTIAVCTVWSSLWWTEELSETCGFFYSKNKFDKLVHLVRFIIIIYHDARSPERQILEHFKELRRTFWTFFANNEQFQSLPYKWNMLNHPKYWCWC